MPFANGIYYEHAPGYQEASGPQAQEVRHPVFVPWSAARQFPAAVLGTVTADLKRTLPLQHPRKPWLYAVRCELREGKGALLENGNDLKFVDNQPDGVKEGWALFEITYRPLPYELTARPPLPSHIIRETNLSLDSLTIEGTIYRWVSDNEPIKAGLSVLAPQGAIRYTWLSVPESAITKIADKAQRDTVGYVNDMDFANFGAETLLCLSPKIGRRYHSPNGLAVRDIVYTFLLRIPGWNFFYRPSTGQHERVVGLLPGVPSPYAPTAGFPALFQAP